MNWKLPPDDKYFGPILQRTPDGFELDHLYFALGYVKEWRAALDGGAHVGTWSCAMAKRFSAVYSFEPAPDTYACLIENTRSHPNVFRFQAALGEKCGRCTVQDDPDRPGNSGARVVAAGEAVTLTTIDALNFGVLDFLKLDVEGWELNALMGARATILRCRPIVMIECKQFKPSRNGGPQKAVNFLEGLGYKAVGGIRNDKVFTYDHQVSG